MDSLIIKEEKDIIMLKKWINPNNHINSQLLYRATRDGDSLNDFHLKYDQLEKFFLPPEASASADTIPIFILISVSGCPEKCQENQY